MGFFYQICKWMIDMRTKEQYMKDLSKMYNNIFYDGERIDRLDEQQIPCINTIGMTFDLAEDPEYADLMKALSESWRMYSALYGM